MSVIIYTAKRKIAAGHVAGTQYQIDIPLQKIDRSSKRIVTRHVSMSGVSETHLQRIDVSYALLTDLLSTQDQSRTNLLVRSSQLDDVAWVKNNITVTADAAVGPFGGMTADKIAVNSTAFANIFQGQNVGATGGRTFFFSVWLWTDVGEPSSGWYLHVDSSTGGTTFNEPVTISSIPQRFYLQCTFPPGETNDTVYVWVGTPDISGRFCYVFGAQLEESTAATEHIPTAGDRVTEPSRLHCMREFLASCAGGEQFEIDFYGTRYVSDDPIMFELDSDDYAETRNGSSPYVSLGFKVREL